MRRGNLEMVKEGMIMKKKLLSICLAVMVCASTMIGCGSVSDDPARENKISEETEKDTEVISTDVTGERTETETDVSSNQQNGSAPADKNVIEAKMDKTLSDIAEQEHVDIDIVQKIEDEFIPALIAAEERCIEAFDMSQEWKELMCEMNRKIAAKADVKLIDLDLNESAATYKVSVPDVITFMTENIDQASSMDELADILDEALERDDIPVKERKIIIPIHLNGSEFSLDFDDNEVMDLITGDFYETYETVK